MTRAGVRYSASVSARLSSTRQQKFHSTFNLYSASVPGRTINNFPAERKALTLAAVSYYMENPHKGRATIEDTFTWLQIIIPAKRNWFTLIFLGFWLCCWFAGEIFALGVVTGLLKGSAEGIPILFWLAGWTITGFFAFRLFLWNLIGKEIITVGQGKLVIDKKGILLFKSRIFDLNEVKNIRVQDDNPGFGGIFARGDDFRAFSLNGPIRFDYGLQNVKCADGIDEAEAEFIVQKLKERHLQAEKNYS